jgi:hypothetical protein
MIDGFLQLLTGLRPARGFAKKNFKNRQFSKHKSIITYLHNQFSAILRKKPNDLKKDFFLTSLLAYSPTHLPTIYLLLMDLPKVYLKLLFNLPIYLPIYLLLNLPKTILQPTFKHTHLARTYLLNHLKLFSALFFFNFYQPSNCLHKSQGWVSKRTSLFFVGYIYRQKAILEIKSAKNQVLLEILNSHNLMEKIKQRSPEFYRWSK